MNGTDVAAGMQTRGTPAREQVEIVSASSHDRNWILDQAKKMRIDHIIERLGLKETDEIISVRVLMTSGKEMQKQTLSKRPWWREEEVEAVYAKWKDALAKFRSAVRSGDSGLIRKASGELDEASGEAADSERRSCEECEESAEDCH